MNYFHTTLYVSLVCLSFAIIPLIAKKPDRAVESIDGSVYEVGTFPKDLYKKLGFKAGLSKEELDKLFDAFYTTKRGEGGSGLGTHIMYNLVTQFLHGQIDAKSTLGKGLCYTIRFPINASVDNNS